MYVITINDKSYKTSFYFNNRTTKIGILINNLNLNIMNYKSYFYSLHYRPYCYSFFVPEDKFLQCWDTDVVSFEKTDGGYIFWIHY